jgi:hypothetical protein
LPFRFGSRTGKSSILTAGIGAVSSHPETFLLMPTDTRKPLKTITCFTLLSTFATIGVAAILFSIGFNRDKPDARFWAHEFGEHSVIR